jgi:arsenate reductase-like glutaredoxin family protein
MNIQIFGTRKCNETRKAQRFFSERGVTFHFKDISNKEQKITKGELENISRVIPLEDLIDKESKQFQKRNMQYMVFDYKEELLEDQLLFKTPIVRNGNKVTVGVNQEVWSDWIQESKKL